MMDDITIQCFPVGSFQTNCYVMHRAESGECIVVDPGEGIDNVLTFLEEKHLRVRGIFLTHGHFDHIYGVPQLRERYRCRVYACEQEKELLENAEWNLSRSLAGISFTICADEFLYDGEQLCVAGMECQVLETPGHTRGGCCYYFKQYGVLFSGDTLFCESVGRSDFITGSASQLVASIQEKIMVLPEETRVLTGHFSETSVGYEKKNNPYL